MNKQDFYCHRHNNHFWRVCVPCLDDIFHSGFGLEYQNIEPLTSEWEDTFSFIEKL